MGRIFSKNSWWYQRLGMWIYDSYQSFFHYLWPKPIRPSELTPEEKIDVDKMIRKDAFYDSLDKAIENCNVKGPDWDLLSHYPEHKHARVIIFLNRTEMTIEEKRATLEFMHQ